MKGYPFATRVRVLWGDMDALGHVNNTRFFRWFEQARIEYCASLGLGVDVPGAVGPILATATCEFLKPVVYPAELVVGVRAGKIGRTSVTLEYALARADDEEAHYARGTSVVVLLRYATGEKVALTDEMRQKMG